MCLRRPNLVNAKNAISYTCIHIKCLVIDSLKSTAMVTVKPAVICAVSPFLCVRYQHDMKDLSTNAPYTLTCLSLVTGDRGVSRGGGAGGDIMMTDCLEAGRE